EDDRAHHGDAQAVKVESGHPGHAELAEQPAAHHGADDAEQDVEEKSFARLVDDLAGDESGDEPENDPRDERHETSSCRSLVGGAVALTEGDGYITRIAARGPANPDRRAVRRQDNEGCRRARPSAWHGRAAGRPVQWPK